MRKNIDALIVDVIILSIKSVLKTLQSFERCCKEGKAIDNMGNFKYNILRGQKCRIRLTSDVNLITYMFRQVEFALQRMQYP